MGRPLGGAAGAPGPTPRGRAPVGELRVGCIGRRSPGRSGGRVPGLTVLVAFALVVVSIMVLVLYVHHIGRSLRVSALVEIVGTETRRLLDEQYPEDEAAPDHPGTLTAPEGVKESLCARKVP